MKRWYKSTRLYGFTFQKTVVVIAVSTLHDQIMAQIAFTNANYQNILLQNHKVYRRMDAFVYLRVI